MPQASIGDLSHTSMTQLVLDQKISALRRFTRFFAQRLAPLEAGPAGSPYSATEVRVLSELAQYEHRTVTALSRSLGLDAGYLSRVIRRLETTGIVSKSADTTDNRQQPLALTEAGRAEVRTLEAITTTRFASLVRTLPPHIHAPLLDAMERIEAAFGADVPARDAAPWLLRQHRSGDISLLAHRQIASAAEEFDFGGSYEVRTLAVAADLLARFSPDDDCAWIAERDGVAVGCVAVRRQGETTATLSLLFVESRVRGIGIGRRLITEAVHFAARAGYTTIELELFDGMKAARYLFHAAGFRHANEVEDDLVVPEHRRQRWQLNLAALP